MNMVEIRMKGEIIALLPANHAMDIMLSTRKTLHVGFDGIYYKSPVLTADEIEVSYHETKD